MLQFHAGRAKNRSHGTCCPTLFSDYFANIAGSDPQTNCGALTIFYCLDRYAFWVVHQGTGYLRYKVRHVLYRVIPCRKLGCLGHRTPSGSGSHGAALKLFPFVSSTARSTRKLLQRAIHRSQEVQGYKPRALCFARPLHFDCAIPRSLRETVLGRASRNLLC
jgi:hypothetical protein